jgi:processive 1,2-diacylglycerol beta-glucosyltransferase
MVEQKVMILTANYGEGHAQVSKVLVSHLKENGVHNVKVVDLMGQSHPLIDSVSRAFYLKSYKALPFMYGWLYHQTKDLPLESKRAKWLHSFGLQKMKQMIADEKPDLLIHTFPGSAASELKARNNLSVPIFSILTDFTLHQRWIHRQMDRYFVATETLKEEIIQAGEPSEKVIVSGIPIRPCFEDQLMNQEDLFEKYELDPKKKVIVILAGAFGVSDDVKRVCQFLKKVPAYQVVLICGKNEALEAEMRRKYQAYSHFRIFGYIDHLHELMKLATCLVSKPGGITISEALSFPVPLVFFPPVPGQEEENARFLQNRKAAIILETNKSMGEQVVRLVQNSERLSLMKRNGKALFVSHAAERITQEIVAFLKKQQTTHNLERVRSRGL